MPEVFNEKGLEAIAGRAVSGDAKGFVQNMEIDDSYASDLGLNIHPFRFWFRPSPIRQSVKVNYESMSVIGMSHEYKTYRNTSNFLFPFELYVNRMMMIKDGAIPTTQKEREGQRTGNPEGGSDQLYALSQQIEAGRRYLEALSVPPATSYGVSGSSPPVCLLVIPGVVTMRARLIDLDINFTEFDISMNISELRAKVTFEEAPMSRFTMQDVLERGSNRTWGII